MSKEKEQSLFMLAAIVRSARPDMKRYACYRMGNADDADDVLQDCFLKVYSKISEQKGAPVSDLRHYLFRTLSHCCSSKVEEKRRRPMVPLSEALSVEESEPRMAEADYERVAGLMQEIPEEQAEVIRLRIYGNNSFREIAEILSIPVSTVKSRFLYGLEKIRKGLSFHP